MARVCAYFSKRQEQKRSAQDHAQGHEHTLLPLLITAHAPVPLDPERHSLAQLPEDVVLLVLSFIDDSDLLTIASLSSSLYRHARHVQHRTVQVNLDKTNQTRSRLNFLARNGLSAVVRVLEIRGSKHTDPAGGEEEILGQIAHMLPSMTGLRDLHWHIPIPFDQWGWQMPAPIPRTFLNCIPTRTRLHTTVVAMDEPHDRIQNFIFQLAGNKNLYSLTVHVAFVNESCCRETMHALKLVLLSCPRLTCLPSLWIGPPLRRGHGILDGPGLNAPYCGLGFFGGERPQALEELGVSYYPWGHEPTAALVGLSSVYCIGYPEKNSEMWYWAEKFDWSQLRRLYDIPSNLALELAPKLTALKEVIFEETFNLRWNKTAFLTQIPLGLELLIIPSWSHVDKSSGPITRHGTSLRKLTVHSLEQLWEDDSLITDSDLLVLCKELPYLAELSLDIRRDKTTDSWPYIALNHIAKFPRLRKVQLWFDLGHGNPAPPKPDLTVSAAHHIFAYLRERNRNIQYLELCSGTPIKRPFVGEPSWANQNSIRLVCEISLQDGDAVNGFVNVFCPNFSKEMNRELRRLSRECRECRESERGLPENEERLFLEVALNGPLTYDEWWGWQEIAWSRQENAQRERKFGLESLVSGASRWMFYVKCGGVWILEMCQRCFR